MTIQYSLTHRTNAMSTLNTDIGINAVIKIFTGTMPANCGTADSGTLLATFAGNAVGFGTAASQVLTASAVAPVSASGTGTAGYFRIYPSAATSTNAVVQGICVQNAVISTSALTAANGNVLTFTATTGVANGMSISGTGVPAGTTVVAFTGTTVTMSQTSTAGVASAASITFSGDMVLTNTSINSGQTCNFNSLTVTAFGV
jgi:hypothetical protein